MTDEFTRQSVAQSLKKMFEGGYFDICTINSGLKAMKITPIGSQYDALKPLHCVDWKDMEPDFRQQVYDRVLALFNDGTSFDLVGIDRHLGTPAHTAIKDAIDGPAKRKAAGLLPFSRRA